MMSSTIAYDVLQVNIYQLSATMAGHVITVAMALCDHYCTSTTNRSNKMNNYHSLFHPLAILRREVSHTL